MTNMQILKDLTSDILVSMYYLIPETMPEDSKHEYQYAVSIEDPKVNIMIMFCKKTAEIMAENFLGTDEFDEQDIFDSLKELINIVVGNYVKEFPTLGIRIPIPTITNNPSKLDITKYDKELLFYNAEPVQILMYKE